MKAWRRGGSLGLAAATVGVMILTVGGVARGQNTIGGDTFDPGEADFVQKQIGTGAGFQFSDDFYLANGLDPDVMRADMVVHPNAFFRECPTPDTCSPGHPVKFDTPPDDRFATARIFVHNMGFNAAGEKLFYPDPPTFFFEEAFQNEETKNLTNRSFVFIFPRTRRPDRPISGVGPNAFPFFCDPDEWSFRPLSPDPCNRRQDNIFDTGNGYLTDNPLQLWRIVFLNWDGPDIDSPQCQAKIAELKARNGEDEEGNPILTSTREVLDVAGPDLIAGFGPNEMLLPNAFADGLGASGVPNPDPRNDIPGVEPDEGGQVCVTIRTRRQVDGLGMVASAENPLDGPPFVV